MDMTEMHFCINFELSQSWISCWVLGSYRLKSQKRKRGGLRKCSLTKHAKRMQKGSYWHCKQDNFGHKVCVGQEFAHLSIPHTLVGI